jgi:hypothetical protein
MVFNPDWNRGKLQRRWLLLEELGKVSGNPQIQRSLHILRTPDSAATVRRIQEEDAGAPSAQPTESTSKCEGCCYICV